MAGLTTHLIAVFIGGVIIYLFSKKWYYSVAFGLGNLIPDLISFGITGLKQKSLNPSIIMTNSWFQPLALFGHNAFNWVIFALIFWLIAALIYGFKKIEQKKFANSILVLVCFISGVVLHLIFDKLIQETNYWI